MVFDAFSVIPIQPVQWGITLGFYSAFSWRPNEPMSRDPRVYRLSVCIACFLKWLFSSLPAFYHIVGVFPCWFIRILYVFGIQLLCWMYIHLLAFCGLPFHSPNGDFWGAEVVNSSKAQFIHLLPCTAGAFSVLLEVFFALETGRYYLMFSSETFLCNLSHSFCSM